MTLARFAAPLDAASIRWHVAGSGELIALTLLVPAGVALVAGEVPLAAVLAATTVVAVAVGRLLRRGSSPPLAMREALVVTGLTYLLAAVLGTPAFLVALPPVDAFFEAMSGFTTTGLTLVGEGAASPGILFLRSYTQWVGGAGIIVLSLVVLSGSSGATAHLYESEFGQENVRGSVVATARVVLVVYAALSAACYAALLVAGAGWFDGLLHTMSAISTAGFSPFPESIGAYDSAVVNGIVVVFLLLSSVSFLLYYQLVAGDRQAVWRDAQLRALLVLTVFGSVVAVALRGSTDAVGADVFHTVSALTTTGFSIGDLADHPQGAQALFVVLMVMGGSAGSTVGGLKLLRVIVLFQLCRSMVTRLLLPPDARVPAKMEGRAIDDDTIRWAVALLGIYLLLAFTSTMTLSLTGASWDDALFESVSALSTVGLSVGVTAPELPAWAKLQLAAGMWVGRVEMLPVLLLLHPRAWRRKGTDARRDRRRR